MSVTLPEAFLMLVIVGLLVAFLVVRRRQSEREKALRAANRGMQADRDRRWNR